MGWLPSGAGAVKRGLFSFNVTVNGPLILSSSVSRHACGPKGKSSHANRLLEVRPERAACLQQDAGRRSRHHSFEQQRTPSTAPGLSAIPERHHYQPGDRVESCRWIPLWPGFDPGEFNSGMPAFVDILFVDLLDCNVN